MNRISCLIVETDQEAIRQIDILSRRIGSIEVRWKTHSVQTGIDITARFIGQVREACDGVHIMAVGAEEIVPRVLDAASLRVPSSAKEGRR